MAVSARFDMLKLPRLALIAGLAIATSSSLRAADALNPGDLDPTFQIGLGASHSVVTLAIHPTNGVIYIGGSFIDYNDQGPGNEVSRFAVLNPNGSLDLTWWNQIKGFNQPGGNGNVNIITLDNQGRVLVGGRFTTFYGRAIKHLVRLNPDGTLDETFNNGSIPNFGPNDEVTSIYVTAADEVLIAGQFTAYNDGTQTLTRNQMLRLKPDMSIDTTFDPGKGAETTSGSPIGTIVQQPDGKILIGGEFSRFQDTAVGRITRLNNDGSLDPTFNPGGQGLASGNIREIELLPDGRIVAVGNIGRYNTTATKNMILLSPTGVLDTSFAPNVSAQIRSVEVQPDGRYLIVGDFRTVGAGSTSRPAAARLNADGTVDLTFDPGTATFRTPEDPNRLDAVIDGKLDPNNFLVLVGDFTHWNMIENVNHITRIATANVTVNTNTAPLITSHPQSLTVTNGNPASFSVTATGTGPLFYQWKKAGVAIAGATNASLTFAAAQTTDAGSYTVCVSNIVGQVESDPATLTVIVPNSPPLIVSQPQSLTVSNGAPAGFSVTASGSVPLFYFWKKNGVFIPGQTNATLSFAAAQPGDQASYKVCVSNNVAVVESDPATLTVLTATPQSPVIVTPPRSLVVTNGNPASFSVVATGDAPLFYFWKKNGAVIPGANGATLSFAAAQIGDQATYKVCVSNSVAVVESDPATLTVIVPAQGPVITAHPLSQQVKEGQSVNFFVGATGTGPLSYQWLYNGIAIPGVTGPSVTFSGVTGASAGNYAVRVSNTVGSTVSSNAVLTVLRPPVITTQPQAQTVQAGTGLTLSVAVTGTAPLGYQWKLNGAAIAGATNATFTVANVQAAQAGTYTVAVSNVCAVVESQGAAVTIGQPPVIVSNPQPLSVLVGQPATFSVTVSGDGPCTYQWRKDGVLIPGATSATLTIASAQHSDEADYSVIVTCPFGTAVSASARLTVTEAPRIIFNPISEVVLAGTNAVISADAVGSEPLTYQWYYEPNFTGLNSGTPVANGTGATLVFRDVGAPLTGSYYCIAQNPFGSAITRSASITVLAPPAITSPPASLSVNSGAFGGFTGAATGTANLEYQWFFNNQPIAGATSPSLALANIQTGQAGSYFLQVSNLLGAVSSTVAMLTVDGNAGTAVRTMELPAVQSGTLTVRFGTTDGQTATVGQIAGIRVQASSDLTNWTDIPAAITIVAGRFQISLNDPSVLPYRFYRVIYP